MRSTVYWVEGDTPTDELSTDTTVPTVDTDYKQEEGGRGGEEGTLDQQKQNIVTGKAIL